MRCKVEPTRQASHKTQRAKRHQSCGASRRIICVQESLVNLAFIDEACTHDRFRVLLVNVDGVAAMGQLQCCTNSDTTAAKNGNTHFQNSATSVRRLPSLSKRVSNRRSALTKDVASSMP